MLWVSALCALVLPAATQAAPPPPWLSFISERHGNRDVFLIRADGSGERQLTHAQEAEYNGPAHGGVLLITSAREHRGVSEQWFSLYRLPDGPLRPLGPRRGLLKHPAFSPDGRYLIFESESAGYRDLYRLRTDTGGLTRLTRNPEGNFAPEVSPRGDRVVFISSRDRRAELYRMRLDGSQQERLSETERDEWSPRISPDGRTLAVVSDREGADRIYLMDLAGRGARRLSERPLDPRLTEEQPAWSPDSKGLAYVLRRPGERARLLLAPIPGQPGAPREITVPGRSVGEPSFSPDGQQLVCSAEAEGGDTQLYLIRVADGAPTQLTTAKGPNWNPSWVP